MQPNRHIDFKLIFIFFWIMGITMSMAAPCAAKDKLRLNPSAIEKDGIFVVSMSTDVTVPGNMAGLKPLNADPTARNVNSLQFDGPILIDRHFEEETFVPQVSAGMAFIPLDNFKIELDLDFTATETALSEYDTRHLSVGVEWDVWRFLSLRAGTYKNMAADDIGWVYTAGLGINFWAARLDMAAELANKPKQLESNENSKELRAALQLRIDF